MSEQDPISSMLTTIRNAQAIGKKSACMPSSKVKEALAKVLCDEGYILGYETEKEGVKSTLKVALKYYQGNPVIEKIKRISKPGLRSYKGCNDIPRVRGGLGVAIISTSQGLMTDRVARAKGLGGEILCTVE